MGYLVRYIKFLIKSTNQYGIHSPFVFNYLTQCLYQKPKKSKHKVEDILVKSISYFEAENIMIYGNDTLQKLLFHYFPKVSEKSGPIDVLYFDTPSGRLSKDVFSNFPLHNDSLIVFNKIHSSKKAFIHWNQYVLSQKATVTIDLFYCGLVFLRQEQVKQHFIIRI